jgi:pimeloyl-ACP methyl ester carboxylesterase
MYTEERIVHDELILSYRYYQSEHSEVIFLFHGFGQTKGLFETFVPSILPYYSVIAIDLFFHGESTVNDNSIDAISINRWNALFNQIVEKHVINRFSLLSFSMGSRFLVALLHAYATRINKIVLIAPDGFGNNFWFSVAASNKLTRSVFQFTMEQPSCLQLMVHIFGAIGIFNSITKRFIDRNLKSGEHRKKIYASWIYFRKLIISKDDFVRLICKNEIELMCFCGKEDQLVSKKSVEQICNQTSAHYLELDLAHHKLIQALENRALIEFFISDRE